MLRVANASYMEDPDTDNTPTSSAIIPVDALPMWLMNGSANAPFVTMQATVDASDLSGLVSGNRYKGAVRAKSTIAESVWSEWSDIEAAPKGYCLSLPAAPTGLQRNLSEKIRAGQILIKWDSVTMASQAGGDDPMDGHVVYDIWARTDPKNGLWRRMQTMPTHANHDGIDSTPLEIAPASLTVDTYPETTLGTSWQFKVRLGNRNGVFGPFGDEVALSSGQLPAAPERTQTSFSNAGRVRLYWDPPAYLGDAPFLKYQVRCTTANSWEDVANTQLNHVLNGKLPIGVIPCFVRAVNAVGAGPEAIGSVTVLQQLVQVT